MNERADGQPAFPSLTRKEKSRFPGIWVAMGGMVFMAIWTGITERDLPQTLAFLFSAGVVAGFFRLYYWWRESRPRRAQALRVDEEGVHALFPRRTHTLRWEEIDRVERWERGRWVVAPRDEDAECITFDHYLEDSQVVGSLIHARLHDLPVLPADALPVPTAAEIAAFFGRPVPLELRAPWPLILTTGICWLLELLLGWVTVWKEPGSAAIAWPGVGVLMLITLWSFLRSMVSRVAVDEEGIRIHSPLADRGRISWREIVGREETVIKGLHRDLKLENTGFGRLLQFIDHLSEQRARVGGVRPAERASASALTEVDPEAAVEPSASALAQAEVGVDKPRLSGAELEQAEVEEVGRTGGEV